MAISQNGKLKLFQGLFSRMVIATMDLRKFTGGSIF